MNTINKDTLAGIVRAQCNCCPSPQMLVNHVQLGATRMVCPQSHRTFLDRGDGLFQPDGEVLRADVMPTPAVEAEVVASPASQDLLSDRPTRTQDKTRISLERATFA
jgi:hypothetical protein